MSDSVILNIKSWVSSPTQGRKHLLELGPTFDISTSYLFENRSLNKDSTLTINCGKKFSLVYISKPAQYTINNGLPMTGQFVALTNNATGVSITITSLEDSTVVSYLLVS